jgi:hypothetical protein
MGELGSFDYPEERSVIFPKGNGAGYGMLFTGNLFIIT